MGPLMPARGKILRTYKSELLFSAFWVATRESHRAGREEPGCVACNWCGTFRRACLYPYKLRAMPVWSQGHVHARGVARRVRTPRSMHEDFRFTSNPGMLAMSQGYGCYRFLLLDRLFAEVWIGCPKYHADNETKSPNSSDVENPD